MAQTRDQATALQQSSPDSSKGGADSLKYDGTPDTRLTAFSPEEGSARSSKAIRPLTLSLPDPRPTKFSSTQSKAFRSNDSLQQQEKDPFVTAPVSKPEQKLSATASAFRPFTQILAARGTGSSVDEDLGTCREDAIQPQPMSVFRETSTDLQLSRCLVISSPSRVVTVSDVKQLLSRFSALGLPCQGEAQIICKGICGYIRFTNLREACMVRCNVQLGGADWVAEFISPPDFVQTVTPGARPATSFEGQLRLLAIRRLNLSLGPSRCVEFIRQLLRAEGDLFAFKLDEGLEDDTIRATVEFADTSVALEAMSKYRVGLNVDGLHIILSFRKEDGLGTPVEGFDGITTPMATPLRDTVQSLAGTFHSLGVTETPPPPNITTLTGSYHQTPSSGALAVHPQLGFYPVVYRNPFTPNTPIVFDSAAIRGHGMAPLTPTHPMMGSMFSHSPGTVPAMSVANDFGSPRTLTPYQRSDGRRQNAMRIPRSPYFNAAGHHNHVDVNKIREGIDVRTTIMLRNIPNKVDQAMLQSIIDESSWGKYDFMYLRIDFANDCNVGYAFINFVDPLDIIDFVNARGNQRWCGLYFNGLRVLECLKKLMMSRNCFKSDKVAEISYATIQGKDCLVQKFRNSSVMLEAPHYRPKLYFTSNGPRPELAGQEEVFPPPDNQSKMKRSCENAEHVGLFTPNAGQHFRDEQRRRRSQYDRGTRLAALEEYDYETAIQHIYVPQ